MSKINLADSFGQWADQFTETPILEQFAEAKAKRHPTCPNCGDNVLREHLNKGHEVCRFCGPTRDLDTYGELEKERFDAWFGQYKDDQLDKVK